MYEFSWQDVELYCCSCLQVLCIACLAIIFIFVSSECNEIFMSGGDCGVGYGWFGLAGGLFVIGVYWAWNVYRLVRERTRSTQTDTV
jgi:membrane associated rhomboid family serine protease